MISKNLNRREFVKTSIAGAASAKSVAGKTIATTRRGNQVAESRADDKPIGIFRSDMSRCQPASAVSRNFEKDRWKLIDYETVEGVKGTMASAMPEHKCGELRLPLEAEGLHKIYLGINYTKSRYPGGQVDVKLTGDQGFRRVVMESGTALPDGGPKIGVNNFNFKSIQEAYWKTADITGKSLVFRQPEYPYSRPEHATISNLSYVRLVPLSEEENREWQKTQPSENTRRLALIFVGPFSGSTNGTSTFHPTTEGWFKNEFEPYINSDIKILALETMRGNYCLFKTKIGDTGREDNRWQEDWKDPLAEFTHLAHANKMKIFATLRMIGPQYPMNREPIAWARHYWRHPEWSKKDRDGVPLSNWSLAFDGVRQYWLSLLREALDYGIDGVQLHLNRSMPFVFYEEPVVRSFKEKHREDPGNLREDDARWQAHCASYVTGYLREVRTLLDEKPGRELGVTIYGEPHKYDTDKSVYHPIRYGCDVETWLREKLVNYVMPSPAINLTLLKKWREIAGDRVHLWPDLMPRTQMPRSYALLARKYYDAGADGFCVWDGDGRPGHLSEFAAVQRLGHRNQLDRLIQESPSYYRRVPLKYLSGFSVKESFHDG